MLGKLLKYDMKFMARILLFVYLGAFGISVLCAAAMLFIPHNVNFLYELIYTLSPSLCIMAIYAVIIMTVVFFIIRVYRSLYSGEGYLTFTLPVKNGTIIDSKIIVGAIWLALSLIVCFIVIIIPDIASEIRYASEAAPTEPGVELVYKATTADILRRVMLLLNVVTLVFFVPSLYVFCSAVTHRARRARAFASIGMFMGILYGLFIVFSIASIVITVSTYNYVDYSDSAISNMAADLPSQSQSAALIEYLPVILLSASWALLSAFTAICWAVSKRIVNKKLNLQ